MEARIPDQGVGKAAPSRGSAGPRPGAGGCGSAWPVSASPQSWPLSSLSLTRTPSLDSGPSLYPGGQDPQLLPSAKTTFPGRSHSQALSARTQTCLPRAPIQLSPLTSKPLITGGRDRTQPSTEVEAGSQQTVSPMATVAHEGSGESPRSGPHPGLGSSEGWRSGKGPLRSVMVPGGTVQGGGGEFLAL